jgi:hypothetical protein
VSDVIVTLNTHQLTVLSRTIGYVKNELLQLEAHFIQACQAHDAAQKAAADAAVAAATPPPAVDAPEKDAAAEPTTSTTESSPLPNAEG